jgi:hypothetical protein
MNRSRCRTAASFERFLTPEGYVDALPRSMQEREEWQMVMEVLLSAVEGWEPVSLLRIALTLALQESGPTRGPRR